MTAALLLALLTALSGIGLLAAVHAWRPGVYLTLSSYMAAWCTVLAMLALVLRDPRQP